MQTKRAFEVDLAMIKKGCALNSIVHEKKIHHSVNQFELRIRQMIEFPKAQVRGSASPCRLNS